MLWIIRLCIDDQHYGNLERTQLRTPANGTPGGRCGASVLIFADERRSWFTLRAPTDPAGKPSFRGRPTGRLILSVTTVGSGSDFLPLPLGRPGLRFRGGALGSTATWKGLTKRKTQIRKLHAPCTMEAVDSAGTFATVSSIMIFWVHVVSVVGIKGMQKLRMKVSRRYISATKTEDTT